MPTDEVEIGVDSPTGLAAHAAHVAAAWTEHRTITTREGIRGLPSGTILRDEGGIVVVRPERMIYPPPPLTILWHPEEDQ